MQRTISPNPGDHPSPWIDNDGDLLVSTASSSSESDVLVESSEPNGKMPRFRRQAPRETQPVIFIIPMVSSSASPHSPQAKKPLHATTSNTSPSPASNASSSTVQPGFDQTSTRLAPLLANLITSNKRWLEQVGVSSNTVEQLLDIVSMLPYGLNGDIKIGSDKFFIDLKKTVKRLAVEGLDADSLSDSLHNVINHLVDPAHNSHKLLKLLMQEIQRSVQTGTGNKPLLEMDVTDGGTAPWIDGPYQISPFSLPVALDQALKKHGALLSRVLGVEPIKVLYQIVSNLPVNLGLGRYASKDLTKHELCTAIEKIDHGLSVLEKAAEVIGDSNYWDGKIYAAMAKLQPWMPPAKRQRIPEDTMTACRMVFSLLQMI